MTPGHMIIVGLAITVGMLVGGEFGYAVVLGMGIGMALAGLVRFIRERKSQEVVSNNG